MSTITPAVLSDLLQLGMEAGNFPYVTITSNSMAPLLQVGDQVRVQPASPEQLRPGDLIMVEGTAELMTHRYWQTWEHNGHRYLLTRGDRLLQFDSPWPTSRLVGRIISRRRRQHHLDLDAGPGRWLNHRLAGIITLEMKLLTGQSQPAADHYQNHLPRLRAANGQPYYWVRLLRRLLWLWAALLSAIVSLWTRFTT
jgi:signal peptidase I